MRTKILAQLINENSGESIRDFYYDLKNETLESIVKKVEDYVVLERINDKTPVRIRVSYV